MKHFFLLLSLLFSAHFLFAQKPVIDSFSYDKFPLLMTPVISNDGKFVAYAISSGKQLTSSKKKPELRLIVKSTNGKDSIKIPRQIVGNVKITADSKYCIFESVNDSLGIFAFGSKTIRYIPNVSSYTILEKGNPNCLLYNSANTGKEIVLLDLKTNKEIIFSGMYGQLTKDGQSLIIVERSGINWFSLGAGRKTNVWKGVGLANIVFDLEHNQLAFKSGDSIFYYKEAMSMPVYLTSLPSQGAAFNFTSFNTFNKSGTSLIINLNHRNRADIVRSNDEVEIWSYKDPKLQSVQENELDQGGSDFLGLIRLDDHQVIPLPEDKYFYGEENNDMVLSCFSGSGGDMNEFWNSTGQMCFALLNTRTGERKQLKWLDRTSYPVLSPCSRYIIYYNETQKSYFSYDVSSEKITDLTGSLGLNDFWEKSEYTGSVPSHRGIAGWLANDEAVLIYGSHDVWKLDPSAQLLPVNITNGYGLKNNIVLSLALPEPYCQTIISKKDPLILSAFNLDTKENGFISKKVEEAGDPEILFMGPFLFKNDSRNLIQYESFTPIKAKNASRYIVRRMSPTDAPNYFSTSDFKTFTRLTDLQPHKAFNWYTTELHTWKSLDGRTLQGILYKPENFDERKKYPVIFYYYERLSDGLNSFLTPDYSYGALDIPTYVSNGYLVFCPDIFYKIGDPMQGTYDAVISAAKYVSALPCVNGGKMGIQGQSWGAQQTNYLITQTDIFKAACSSAGSANWISLNFSTGTLEKGQFRASKSLWDDLQMYLKNSAVLKAHKVSTPILMRQGKLDTGSPFTNALEFFLGLRQLGKKAWLLAYPNAGHVLRGNDAKDFTIRMMQFFDHYLKDKPAPIWMLDGIPAAKRGIDSGLQLDTSGRTPGPGILTPEEQSKADSLMTRKPVTVILD